MARVPLRQPSKLYNKPINDNQIIAKPTIYSGTYIYQYNREGNPLLPANNLYILPLCYQMVAHVSYLQHICVNLET